MLVTTECEQVLLSISEKELTAAPAKRSRTESEKSSSSLWNIFDDMIERPSELNSSVSGDMSGYTAEVMAEMY
jgi:L-serine deaminase